MGGSWRSVRCLPRSGSLHRCNARYLSTASVPAPPYDILFCGTDAFAHAALQAILSRSDLYTSMHVLTPPDVKHKWGARRMRVSPVKQLALTHAIPTCELPAAGMDMFPLPSALQTSKAPMLVTASFGHRIPTTLLHQFPSPSLTLNLHPSMLPDLRGAAPIQWALARGYTETGITVQQLHPTHFDQGGILKQVPFAIPAGSTYLSLLPSIAERGAQLLVDVMATLPTCHTQLQSQHGMPGTRAPKLAPKFSVVRWDRWTAASIDGRQRGFGYAQPITMTLKPPSHTRFPSVNVAIREGYVCPPGLFPALPHAGRGVYVPERQAIALQTIDGIYLATYLQTQGKPIRSADAWWQGFRDRADADGYLHFV